MQYSPVPFHVISGTIEKPEDVIVFPNEFYEKQRIKMMLGVEAKKIDRERKVIITDKGRFPTISWFLLLDQGLLFPDKGCRKRGSVHAKEPR